MREEALLRELEETAPLLRGRVYSPKPLRLYTEFLTPEEFIQVIKLAKEKLGFTRGLHVVGTDEGAELGFSYLLANREGCILILREKAPKRDPRIPSVTALFPSMLMHERELADLFGAVVQSLPEGPGYPLPEDWPAGQYPMRKEWNPAYFDQETMRYAPPVAAEEGSAQ